MFEKLIFKNVISSFFIFNSFAVLSKNELGAISTFENLKFSLWSDLLLVIFKRFVLLLIVCVHAHTHVHALVPIEQEGGPDLLETEL